MELLVYLLTAGLCIFWSVKLYNDWYFLAHFPEASTFRVLLLIIPASFFLGLLLSTWAYGESFRLDILGLLIYNAGIVLSFAMLYIVKPVLGERRAFLTGLVFFLLVSSATLGIAGIIRLYPLVLMKLTFYFEQLGDRAFLESLLFRFEPESEGSAMRSLANKAVIALISYLPVTVIRFFYFRRSQQRLKHEIKELRERIVTLEKIVIHE